MRRSTATAKIMKASLGAIHCKEVEGKAGEPEKERT